MRVLAQALVVVDVQRAVVERLADGDALLSALESLLSRARSLGVPVIHVQDHGDVLTRSGTPGWELVLPVAPGEPVVAKSADDAFDGTDLASLLAGVSCVCVVGIQSEMCVAGTARGAQARGMTVVLPRDGHATFDIPARGSAPGVPAALVSRVAEWSLGDQVVAPDSVSEVEFSV